ncbi:MAG: GNAT family N-acetyltransferase [Rhodobacteraceae bacterium]|nr:GNAT family N-acetyltransferase [Paracoccaceae bacterium]
MSEAILTTQRLRLRRPGPQDLDGYRRFVRSQRARYFYFAKNDEEAWKLYCMELAHWDLRGFGMFAITTHEDDTCLGLVGHWYPEGWIEREIGWLLWPEAEGKGYGYEAARACVDYAFDVLDWDTAVSYIEEGNTRSFALAEKLGAYWDEAATTRAPDLRVYRHPHPSERTEEGSA